METKKTQCGVYARVSTELDSQKTSVPNQLDFFMNYISNNDNYELYKTYVDDGISGKFTKKRTDFKQMLKDGEDKKFDLLLVKSLSRFGRNNRETLNNLNELYKTNVRVLFIEDNLDTEKDRSMVGLFSWLAEQEARKISDRQKFVKAQQKSKGLFPYNRPPYGYKLIKHVLTPVKEEADIVRKIFELYINGGGITSIARYLNESGFKPKRANIWSNNSLKVIITNPNYTGNIYYNKSYKNDTMDEKSIFNPKEEWEEVKNTHEAIIDEETFKTASIEHDKRLKKYNKQERQSSNDIFSNLLKCGRCGDTYGKKKIHGKKYVYSCNNYELYGLSGGHRKPCNREAIDADDLVETVSKFTTLLANEPELIDEMYNATLKKINKTNSNPEDELKTIDASLLKLDNKSHKLLDLYTEAIIGKDQFKKQNDEIQIIIEKLTNEKMYINSNKIIREDLNKKYAILKEKVSLLSNIDSWTNQLLKDCIESIVIYEKDKIEINLVINKDIFGNSFQISEYQQVNKYEFGTLLSTINVEISTGKYSIAI